MSNEIMIRMEQIVKTYYIGQPNELEILHGINLDVKRGEFVSIVGESGSGKSMTAMAIAGLLRRHDMKKSGEILFEGTELLHAKRSLLRQYQGNDISMVFQEPMTSLNPVKRIGWQVEEALRLHTELSKEERKKRAIEMLEKVELHNPQQVYEQYPHELSGGMRQRVALARAFTMDSEILLMDEPFSALDKQTSNHLRQELQDIWMKTHKTIFFITHSVEEAVYLGDRVVVMSGEDGGIKNIVPIELDRPRHIYNEDFIAYRHKILEEIQGGDY